MIKNLLFIFAYFVCISAYNNFFTEIRKDPDACNYYVPNQERCQRVFVNIEALTKNPSWMKIDLQTIMPELERKIWLFMELKRTYKLFETTVLREYEVTNFHFYLIAVP
jgi:hypothetical protein